MFKPTEFMFTDEDGTTLYAVLDGDDLKTVHLTIWPDNRDDRPLAQIDVPLTELKRITRIGAPR